MEQQGVATSTIANGRLPGVPSDASVLDFLRRTVQRGGVKKRLKSEPEAQTELQVIRTGHIKKPQLRSTATRPTFPTIELQMGTEPAHSSVTDSDSRSNQTLSTSNGFTAHSEPDLLTKNDRIRRILAMVNWTKVRRDTVQQVAIFQEPVDAEIKFQEFESFIRAEGRNLGLPEGCKPFERVLIRGDKPGDKPCPYISFTNFRTEEDVRKYHAALSKRKVRQQYYPPLRLCYEIQRLSYHAADAILHLEGNSEDTLCGKIAQIEVDGVRRAVTIGGVIQVDNRLYALTAGHSATDDQNTPTSDNFIDDVDDSGYDDDIEPALICGGPNTTYNAQSRPHPSPHNERFPARMASTTLNFKGSSMMGDDWSLHLIDDPLLALPNSFPERGSATTRYMTYPASHPVSDSVWLLAGVSGHREVSMLPGTVVFPLPSGNWINAWKISLESTSHISTPLQHGDSGSWIIDRTNGHVFGHVIASTETSAFLIPLIHTIDAISSQAKLKGPGDVIFLPPAFDAFANIAHARYNRSTENDQDSAKWFASQALMRSTLLQSPTSVIAPVITDCLEFHQSLQEPIRDILQKLLLLSGADLKATVTEIWHNGQIEDLIDAFDITSGIERTAAQIVIRDLVTGLNILSVGPSASLWSSWPSESSEVVQAPTSSQSARSQDYKSEARLQSIDEEPGSQFSQAQEHTRRMDEDRSREVRPDSPRLQPQDFQACRSPIMTGPLSHSKLDSTNPMQMVDRSKQDTDGGPENNERYFQQRVRSLFSSQPLVCAVISAIVAALVAAVSVLGAFLGVEVQQNKSLQERLSNLVDADPSICYTVITSTFSTTKSVTATAQAAVDSCNGMSSGGWYGIGVASAVVIGILFLVLYIYNSLRRRRMSHLSKAASPALPALEGPVLPPGATNWDSTTVGYTSIPPVLNLNNPNERSEFTERPLETVPSHHVLSDQQTSGLQTDPATLVDKAPLHRHPSARVEDVLHLPDPIAATLQKSD